MQLNAGDMLRRLASGVHPGGVGSAVSHRTIESEDFSALLSSVRTGDITSGRPIEVKDDAGAPLTGDQLERLGVATDAAEAAGSRRLLAMIDGGAVTVDVAERRIVESAASIAGVVLTEIDGFVLVPEGRASELRALFAEKGDRSARSASDQSGTIFGLDAIRNASVATILESLRSNTRETSVEDRAA